MPLGDPSRFLLGASIKLVLGESLGEPLGEPLGDPNGDVILVWTVQLT